MFAIGPGLKSAIIAMISVKLVGFNSFSHLVIPLPLN